MYEQIIDLLVSSLSALVVVANQGYHTFKCIGSTHDNGAQECLSKVTRILCDNGTVETKVAPEPNNVYDAKAIAFVCKVDGNWVRIGYVVKECLPHVHKAFFRETNPGS